MDPRYYIAAHSELIERRRSAERARLVRSGGPSVVRARAGAMLIRMGCRLARDHRSAPAAVNA
ncbi:MAG TPA: hypothetical protein VHX59_13065 [Mycobacteriales bacterium]|jgi:hypothetical protein|nr:hypothetical protein [Mycobacteriales bacterium]